MRALTNVVWALSISCAMFGCAGPPTASGVSLTHRVSYEGGPTNQPAGAIPALVLSGNRDLFLFNSNDQQIGKIPVNGGDGAVAMDKQGNIYYDSYNQYSDRVLIFAPPYTGKPKIISFYSKGYSEGVTVDWKTGVVAVAMDAFNPEPDEYSAVWFFRHGSIKPCAMVKISSGWYWAPTGSFDAEGTFFAAGTESSGETIASIAGECAAKTIKQYNPVITNFLRMQFNTKNQLVIDESTGYSPDLIVTYAHPANGQLNELSTTTLDDINGNAVGFLAFTGEGQRVWAAAFSGGVGLYAYPKGGAPIQTMNLSLIGGGAAYPPAIP